MIQNYHLIYHEIFINSYSIFVNPLHALTEEESKYAIHMEKATASEGVVEYHTGIVSKWD